MTAPRKTLAKIVPYQLPPFSRKDKLRLDLNENIMGCSPKVIDAIRNVDADDIAVYPEYRTLLTKIARYCKVDVKNILLTNGADDAIRCVMDAYIEKGDEVIIPVPTFVMFEILAELRSAKIVKILYNKDFSFPTEKLLKRISEKTKLIVIACPSNPLGTPIARDDLIEILNEAKNSIVFLDETYHHFAKKTYIKLTEDFNNLIVIQTFSKAFGLAGLRLGYIVADRKNIENLSKVSLPYSVSSLAVIAGSAALDDKKYVKKIVEKIETEKDFLCKELKKLGIAVRTTNTNFLLVNFGEACDEVYKKLIQKGILVKNLNTQPLLKGYLRITVGGRKENLILLEAVHEITEVLK